MAVGNEIGDVVRRTLRSPGYGHPAHTELATGYGPCRQCLRDFAVGQERRILFTYDSFYGTESLPLPGPVFIHAAECERYPEDGGFPSDSRARPLTLNAYAAGRRLVAQQYVSDGDVDSRIEQLFGRDEVSYIHVRDTVAGCYDFRIERFDDKKEIGADTNETGGPSHE
ncbi:MAG TPA: DUF1203 domain-containing protein [Gemmatimonadaceae bacterium]